MRRLAITFAAVTALFAFFCSSAFAAPPAILKTGFSHVTTGSAILEALIDPLGKNTKYRFEYGTADCASNPCTQVPVPEGKVPATAIGSGDLVSQASGATEQEAKTITNVFASAGSFGVGQSISGPGIPAATKIAAVDVAAKTLTLSKAATATGTAIALAATGPQPVSFAVTGLASGTVYHLRVVATNGEKAEGPDTPFATFRPAQLFPACPANEAFRAERPSAALPDCRAYEQASPLDKNGVDARGRVAWVRAGANGEAVSYGAAGAIPGAEGSQELPAYLASRAGGAWSTQGLLPNANAGQEAFVLGWTPDFAQSFSEGRRLGPPKKLSFLERSSADGALTEVAPYDSGVIEPRFAGATGDGSEVVFESRAKLTPTAIAGKTNLYAWARATNALRLAGALNDPTPGGEGQSPPEGAFAGSYDWIAGTTPASLRIGGASANYYTQDQHAVAADGSVVFTEAGSGQLYLRRNPTQPQSALDGAGKCTEPALACTLQLSASRKDNGTGPEGHDAAGTRPAAFMSATPDGKSVLFASSEKLTNDATTGEEPPPAALGRANLPAGDGKKVDLCLTVARGVAVDGSHLYWANPTAGTISRAGLECESPEEILSGLQSPQYVAVDAGHIYWTAAGDGTAGGGTIGRAKLTAGGAEEAEGSFVEGASNPQGIAVDSEHLYWANAGDEVATRTIGRAKLGATEAEEVEQAFIQVDEGGGVKYAPQGIAVNATHIYATIDGTQEFSYLFRYDIDGAEASRKLLFDAKHENTPGDRGIALDAGHVYWAGQGADSIGRANLDLDLASREREFVKAAGHPLGLAADGAHLYWAVNGEVLPNPGNDLYRYDTATGELSDLSVDASDPNGAEVKGVLGISDDASYVYFVANGVLAAGAAPGDCRGSASSSSFIGFAGECSLYLAHAGEATRFVARLDAGTSGTRTDATNWLPHGGLTGQIEKTGRVAADGSAVLFRSQQRLGPYDNEGVPELYRYAVGEAGPTCVSCNPSLAEPEGGPGFGNINLYNLIPTDPAFTLSRNLSADGERAFFETTEALVGADTNGADGCPPEEHTQANFPSCQDVYEWEAKGTGSCEEDIQGGGCLYLLSTGKSPHASFIADASASGEDAFLITSSPGLVRQDQDQLYDVYDARVGGGLSGQDAPPLPACESGEACHVSAKPAPAFATPASAAFKGPGNVKPDCPKGKRAVKAKGKTRCVAKKQKKKSGKRHKRAAKQSGRAGE